MKQSLKTLMVGYDKEQFIFPLSLWALFLLLCTVFFDGQQAINTAGAFLGYLLPLLSGILAAYALLSDPILELRFSTQRSSWRMLAERILLLLIFFAFLALSFQGAIALAGISLVRWGNFFQRQLMWAVPTMASLALGCLTAFLGGNAMTGAGISGGLWIFQLLLRGWFSQEPVLQYGFLFQAIEKAPGSTALMWNQISLTTITIIFLTISALLLKRQERYIK